MAKRYSDKEKNLPPSRRKYAQHMRVPKGCVDIWRINGVRASGGSPTVIDSQWFDRDKCMKRADQIWREMHEAVAPRWPKYLHVYVEHKAAMNIDGKYHIVNIPSFIAEDFGNEAEDPDPEHKDWIASFDSKCEEAQMGGITCPSGRCCRPGFCKLTEEES